VGGQPVSNFHYDAKSKSVSVTVPFSQAPNEVVIQY